MTENNPLVILKILPRCLSGSVDIPYETKMIDIANKIAKCLYEKPLSACLGKAQNVRVNALKKYDIRVYLPDEPTPVKKKVVKKSAKASKKKGSGKYTVVSSYHSCKKERKLETTLSRIRSMVNHAKRQGITISTI